MDVRSVVVTAVVGLCVTAVAAGDATAGENLKGPNVCTYLRMNTKKTADVQYGTLQTVKSHLCIIHFNFHCYTKVNLTIPLTTNTTSRHFDVVKKCCEGYKPIENGTQCTPVCDMPPCVHGTCISPNVCKCDKLYNGPSCNTSIACPIGRYGINCSQSCECQNNAYCSSLDGSCSCEVGFIGSQCEDKCSEGFYGYKCKKRCNCQNGATCDAIYGTCNCQAGFVGNKCQYTCPSGFYGDKCKHQCNCKNNATCDSVNGACSCLPGFIGSNCEIQCPPNINIHQCQRITKCNSTDGSCNCKPGWTGYNCETRCPRGTYGLNCDSTCQCRNGGICRSDDGICLCPPGFYGPTCIQDNSCVAALQSEPEYDYTSFWILDSMVILSFILISIVCAILLLCYYYCYRCHMKHNIRAHINTLRLQRSMERKAQSFKGVSTINSEIMQIKKQNMSNYLYDSERPDISYTNQTFYSGYSCSKDISYGTRENIYLEIDESTIQKRPEDLYDHLDFLRPTGSWKPHYQKAIAPQDQNSKSSNVDENVV